jgi:regulator of protease activity HflC (stomatin/prohibitin superfamily)
MTKEEKPGHDGDSRAMTERSHADTDPDGPVAQSLRIGFGVLQAATIALSLGWAASNIRQVPPHSQAVVLRFGEVIRVQTAGLVVAWPRPFEQVDILPGPERQLDLRILAAAPAGQAIVDPASRASGEVPPDSAGVYLTGDGGVVLLDASLTYRITDARAFHLAASHVEPALRRLFLASAVSVAASRALDDFMVVGRDRDAAAQAQRQAMRGALVQEVNRRLRGLQPREASLGVEATRADVTALLPPAAKFAFDAVLDATQMAEQGLAAAHTDAARLRQAADQEQDRIIAEARANADERVGAARTHVATVAALERRMDPASRPSLLDQVYRGRIAGILRQAGIVNTVDMRGGSRVILPGTQP